MCCLNKQLFIVELLVKFSVSKRLMSDGSVFQSIIVRGK